MKNESRRRIRRSVKHREEKGRAESKDSKIKSVKKEPSQRRTECVEPKYPEGNRGTKEKECAREISGPNT
jgi:hypothetical protein